jgi:hypothetical protein
MDVPYTYNSMIYATVRETSWENLSDNYELLLESEDSATILIQAIGVALNNSRPLPEGGMIFTDDKAPIERITNLMVLNNILTDPALLGD